ncbi:cytochrome P450 family protein [Kribbella catacumbae]|uniref:cytochrome P450 family protein n=1 Tax=Kribbella catacumbae TaxID=460086 RepID=UPI00058E3BEC|nr:cytochrome P450 [Kribbella catacumbae]
MITPSNPSDAYAGLRAAGPVHRISGSDGKPAWLVTRYDDVRQALADPRLSLDKRNGLPGNYRGMALPPALDANLLNLDPPDHTRIRRLVSQAFTTRRVDALRAPIRSTAEALLDEVIAAGTADLLSAYAAPLPIAVICDLLGVPEEARTDFRQWTDVLVAPDPSRPDEARQAIGAMLAFFAELISSKRAAPGDDLVSDMIAAQDEGDRLSDDELTSLVFLILFAGYENVVHLIGNATIALLDDPEQWKRLQADRSLIPAAVEEFLRYDGPAPLAIRRFPLVDVTIGGELIPAGETVLLGIASANRDATRFPDADRLDFDRVTAGHLALGHGIHYCLGAPLARLETAIALDVLLDRAPRLRLAVPREELEWRPSIRTRGLTALPIAVRP